MQLLKITTERRDYITSILLPLIAVTIPFFINVGNLSIIIAVAFNVFFFQKHSLNKLKSFKGWFPIVFFFITVLSGYFSKNIENGVRHLDLTLLLILIVIIIANSNITKALVFKTLKFLYIGSVISTLILFVNATVVFLETKSFYAITFRNFTTLYDQHPVYYSMYLSLALCYYFNTKKEKRKAIFKNKIVRALSNCVLFVGLVMCASKAVLAIDLAAIALFYLLRIKNKKKQLLSIVVLLALAVTVFKIPFINIRFQDGLRFNESIASFKPTNDFTKKKSFSYTEKTDISDLELRYIFGSVGMYHLVKDKKLLFGYGQGDTKDYLNYYYFSYNLGPNWYEGFNVHNQYFHFIIMYGIIVFIFFLSYLLYSFKEAIKNNDQIHLFFLILVSFVFIFEVLLARNKGIIFFYFINTLFLFKNTHIENSNTRN